MIAPVAGSGSCPSWIARVSKSMPRSLRVRDVFGAEDAGQARERRVERVVEVRPDSGLGVERLHDEAAFAAVVLEVGTADQAVAPEERQDVVAVHALVLALVDLDHVAEAEDPLEVGAVPDEVVERAEEDGARERTVRLRPGR